MGRMSYASHRRDLVDAIEAILVVGGWSDVDQVIAELRPAPPSVPETRRRYASNAERQAAYRARKTPTK